MSQVIGTNVASLTTQRNLNGSQGMLASSLQRLSSGLRINSAKDDAAGLAISERFSAQIRGMEQARRNANDGISLSQTAEGALNEMTNNLQRIRELAVQAANPTNSASDRSALDAEVQQRLSELTRVGEQTTFNGSRLLDGSFGTATFQVGANVGETISLSLTQGVKATQIGQIASGTSSVEVTTANLTGTGTITVGSGSAVTIGVASAGTAVGQTVGSAYAKAAAINTASVPGLTASATNNVEFDLTAAGGSAGDTYSLRINGVDIYAAASSATALSAQTITDAINAQSSNTGVSATLTSGVLRLTASDGRDIAIGQDVSSGAAGGIAAQGNGASTVSGVTYRDGQIGTTAQATANSTTAAAVNGGTLTLSASDNIVIAGDGAILGFAGASHTITKDSTTLSTQNVLTVSAANNMITRVDAALSTVSSLRGTFGAVQNRLESTIANLQTTSENLSASRSRIRDADFAQETAQLTRAQILQQAGTAMLAQANAIPNNVLSLLRG
jgi:flagellin